MTTKNEKLVHLKIKIKTLSAEASIIRKEEEKALSNARGWSRFNLRSCTCEPCERTDEGAHNSRYMSLHAHRTYNVRRAARHNQLAYGFLRGRSYAQMESCCRALPDFAEIERLARRFSSTWDVQAWKQWLDEARGYATEHQVERKAA